MIPCHIGNTDPIQTQKLEADGRPPVAAVIVLYNDDAWRRMDIFKFVPSPPPGSCRVPVSGRLPTSCTVVHRRQEYYKRVRQFFIKVQLKLNPIKIGQTSSRV